MWVSSLCWLVCFCGWSGSQALVVGISFQFCYAQAPVPVHFSGEARERQPGPTHRPTEWKKKNGTFFQDCFCMLIARSLVNNIVEMLVNNLVKKFVENLTKKLVKQMLENVKNKLEEMKTGGKYPWSGKDSRRGLVLKPVGAVVHFGPEVVRFCQEVFHFVDLGALAKLFTGRNRCFCRTHLTPSLEEFTRGYPT